MPVDLYGAACVSDGTSIYCAGGYSFSFPGLVPQLIRYDPGTNTWTALAPIPVPLFHGFRCVLSTYKQDLRLRWLGPGRPDSQQSEPDLRYCLQYVEHRHTVARSARVYGFRL